MNYVLHPYRYVIIMSAVDYCIDYAPRIASYTIIRFLNTSPTTLNAMHGATANG